MFKRDFRSSYVVQNNIGHALYLVMSGNGDDGHGKRKRPGSVDSDQAVDRSLQKKSGIFVNQVGAMPMTHHKVKISFLQEIVFHATHDRSRIAVADLGNDDADGEAPLCTQRTREEIRAVFVLL